MMGLQIVAELAQGFEGKLQQAILLLRAAAKAGADVAKFQMVYADELATPDYEHYSLFKNLELDDGDWLVLSSLAEELKIELYLDIFGSKSLNLAEKMNIKAVKLHGTDITNHDLLQKVASSQIQVVVLGAGGAFLDEIESALKILANKQIIIMLGFQGYPTHTDENQISRIGLLRNRYFKNFSNISIGFADHVENNATLSCSLSALAIGMGATMIEKHLTLGCVMEMEDYESALNPDEFERFVDVIRNSYSALGVTSLSNDFGMCEAETNYRNKIRRHVVASKDLIAGQVINFADLTLKRTSSTKSVNDINVIHGKKTTRFLEKNRPITLADISD